MKLPATLVASGRYEEFAKGPGARQGRSNSLKWPWLYDKLRAKGYSKSKAAAISNSRIGMRKKGRLSLLTAKQAHDPKVLKRLGEAKGHVTKGKLLRASAELGLSYEFACKSKACAPPPVGTGGSTGTGAAEKAYNSGYAAGRRGNPEALQNADMRRVGPSWYKGFFDGEGGHPKGHSLENDMKTFKVITAAQARGDSRPVSHEEFQRLARIGQGQLDKMASTSSPTTGLDKNWDTIKTETFAEVQKSWGGATIDSHTGQALPQGANKYAITVKGGQKTVSVPENATLEQFAAAMDKARKDFGPILERQSHYLGVFHDDQHKRIDIDPVIVVTDRADVDTIGAASHSIGGAYNFADGNGYWPPHVGEG